MNYAVLLTTRAARELAAFPKEVVARMDPRLTDLGTDPRPPGCKKLRLGEGDGWRIRVGDYCVLYRIDDSSRRVLVYRIGHRRDVYE